MTSTEPSDHHAPSSPPSTIRVRTTLPTVPPSISETPIRSERLLLRPFEVRDIEAIHELRTQREVMKWTSVGIVDKDINESRAFVERFLPPNNLETYNFVIVYLDESKDMVIGSGGCYRIQPKMGWPEVGYMLRKEYWSMGIGTEFVRRFSEAWWALPRSEVVLVVDATSVRDPKHGGEETRVPEILTAMIEKPNIGSRRVLEKAGFTEFKQWTQPDSRVGFEGADVTLVKFKLEAPGSRIGDVSGC
ncbi:acetyltransferase domain-containing protein [Xylaria nigripes]|nr:acetyltransferase domain-containing protein [Xylaria nigripes]